MNYGDKTDIEARITQEPQNNTSITPLKQPRVMLKYSLFYYWQYFLVVYRILFREVVYTKAGYHLGRKR